MIKKTALLLIVLLCCKNLTAQDFKVNINKLTEETQLLSESQDKMQLVWWIPTDFWKAIFDQDKNMPKTQAENMLEHLEKYTMVVAVDGNIDMNGDITYHSDEEIFNTLRVIDDAGEKYNPLQHDEIDLDTQQLISVIKPILGQMLGKVGENMHFYLFQKRDDPLNKIVDPLQSNSFVIELTNEKFKWDLPLASLLKPKKCSVDNKQLDGTYTFCPYHGNKLAKN